MSSLADAPSSSQACPAAGLLVDNFALRNLQHTGIDGEQQINISVAINILRRRRGDAAATQGLVAKRLSVPGIAHDADQPVTRLHRDSPDRDSQS